MSSDKRREEKQKRREEEKIRIIIKNPPYNVLRIYKGQYSA